MNDLTKLRLYLLNQDQLVIEMFITLAELKASYPKQWLLSQNTETTFICLVLEAWCQGYENWNVGIYDIVDR